MTGEEWPNGGASPDPESILHCSASGLHGVYIGLTLDNPEAGPCQSGPRIWPRNQGLGFT